MPVGAALGHNSGGVTIEVEVRMFNSIARHGGGNGQGRKLSLPAGTTVGELADRLAIPRDQLFLVLVNGRDVTPGLVGAGIKAYHTIEDGDVVAFSGAVPYSYGYGAPVV
jgi:hypothetical protein